MINLSKRHIRLIEFVIILLLCLFLIHHLSNIIVNQPRLGLNTSTPSDHGLPYTEERIPVSDKNNCYGWYIPANGSDKLIMLVHGRGTNRQDVLPFAPFLHKAGYNLFLIDLRNCGKSYAGLCTMGYYESRDLVRAVAYISSKYHQREVGMLGLSMGAAASVLAAGQIKELKALILDSPFYSFRAILDERFREDYPYYPEFIKNIVYRYSEWRLGFKLDDIDIGKALTGLKVPALIIHGKKDTYINVKNSLRLFEKANQPKELWITEKGTHVGNHQEYTREYEDRVLTFLAKYL